MTVSLNEYAWLPQSIKHNKQLMKHKQTFRNISATAQEKNWLECQAANLDGGTDRVLCRI